MTEGQNYIVIDNGTGNIKAGFSGEESPKVVIPSIVAKQKEGILFESDTKETLFGKDAIEKLGLSNTVQPIEKGIITNFDQIEILWKNILCNELKVDPSECNILLTDNPLNNPENRKEMVRMMFEKFKVQGLFISNTSVMNVYSTGRTLGMVVDSGYDVTTFAPIYEGYTFDHGVLQSNLGGKHLTDNLIKLLSDKKFNLDTNKMLLQVNEIKENYFFVSTDINERNLEEEKIKENVQLPDGEELIIGKERYLIPEILFQPYGENKVPAFQEQCFNSIQKIDVEIRKELFNNIIIAGGNTLFQGFPERMNKEIQKLTSIPTKIIALPERKYGSWIGGSILSALSNFQCLWITRQEYEAKGSEIVYKKCL